MSVTDQEKKIRILDPVFEELRKKLGELRDMPDEIFTDTEKYFIAKLEYILENENTSSYDAFLLQLTEDELNAFYERVRNFVTLFSTRIHMDTKHLNFYVDVPHIKRCFYFHKIVSKLFWY